MDLRDVGPVLRAATQVARDGPEGQRALERVLSEAQISRDSVASLARPDPDRPYGRRVLLANDQVEAMLATWTRGVPCAPHDHGGSVGGVRVLQGAALHRVWRVRDGQLQLVMEERVEAGHVLSCGADLVHSMVDAGHEDPLVTLHLYAGPIRYMVVYDLEGAQTLIVDGGCGAWLPWGEPHLIRAVLPGLQPPDAVA